MNPHRFIKDARSAFTLLELAALLLGVSLLTTAAAVRIAFTLIEICVILLVVTILGGIMLTKITQDTRREKQAALERQMDAVENALKRFAARNKRLPCPANFTRQRDVDANFGIEGTVRGTCQNDGSPDSIASNYISNGIAYGVVPVRTLASYGLTDNDMFDPFGGAIMYAVATAGTATNALVTHPATSPEPGSIKIRDAGGATSYRTESALALILSFGPDKHGAPMISGQRAGMGATNADTLQNCHCDANGNPVGAGVDDTFVLQVGNSDPIDLASRFDDKGRYFLRQGFNAGPVPAPSPSPDPTPDHCPPDVCGNDVYTCYNCQDYINFMPISSLMGVCAITDPGNYNSGTGNGTSCANQFISCNTSADCVPPNPDPTPAPYPDPAPMPSPSPMPDPAPMPEPAPYPAPAPPMPEPDPAPSPAPSFMYCWKCVTVIGGWTSSAYALCSTTDPSGPVPSPVSDIQCNAIPGTCNTAADCNM